EPTGTEDPSARRDACRRADDVVARAFAAAACRRSFSSYRARDRAFPCRCGDRRFRSDIFPPRQDDDQPAEAFRNDLARHLGHFSLHPQSDVPWSAFASRRLGDCGVVSSPAARAGRFLSLHQSLPDRTRRTRIGCALRHRIRRLQGQGTALAMNSIGIRETILIAATMALGLVVDVHTDLFGQTLLSAAVWAVLAWVVWSVPRAERFGLVAC